LLYDRVDLVLDRFIVVAVFGAGECSIERRRGLAPLTGMRLVDQDREAAVAMLRANIVEDEGKFLDRRDDDLLAVLDEAPQIA
jgi:hypothetical protein